MAEHEVYPTLLKITGGPVEATAALLALNEVVQEQEKNRLTDFLAYAEGYKQWIMAGLGPLTSDELKEIGQSSSDILSAFIQRIEQRRKPWGRISP